MRLLVAAAQDKSNDKIQVAADNAVKLAQNAAAFRKAIERLDFRMLNQRAPKHDLDLTERRFRVNRTETESNRPKPN